MMGAHPESGRPGRWLWRYVLPRQVPLPAILVFSAGVMFAFSPNILEVYGIHNDYEMLNFKSATFFHPEAEALFAIGRPVAALLTNLIMLPVQTLSDYRWTRVFSILTVCFLGCQLMALCIHRLRTRVQDAVAIALVTFLVPPFIYSVLNATAWAPHLFSVFLVFAAYGILSRSSLLLVSFRESLDRRDWRLLPDQVLAYARLKPVWAASIVYQLALYDYPPNAMMLALCPVIMVLFSRAPAFYRGLVALRDIAFIGANVVVFAVSVKLIYLPFARLFTSLGSGAPNPADADPLAERLTATYKFTFNLDPGAALERLGNLFDVSGDLWFLPQTKFHVAAGSVMVLALVLAQLSTLLGGGAKKPSANCGTGPLLNRLSVADRGLPALVAIGVCVACFIIAGSAILASATGFITYRTIAVPTAVLAVVSLFAVRGIVEWAWRIAGGSAIASARMADVALGLLAFAATGANFYLNDLTLRLVRNEFAYFTAVVRHAVETGSRTIVIVDPRPFSLPEDIPVMNDRHGRALPPYELGCLSGYCMQSGSIVQIAARELGYPPGRFNVFSARGPRAIAGMSCETLTDEKAAIPATASPQARAAIRWYRSLAPLTCVSYGLDWHDVGIDLRR
jgi:hypothetical protein